MDLSTLSTGRKKKQQRKRVGRGHGSGSGKTSGRGHKGQRSRSGYSKRAGFEGGQMPLHRRLPKRGFNHETRFPYVIVNLDILDQAFDAGSEVSLETLIDHGLAAPSKGGIKVLGRGELTKKLTLKVSAISQSAKDKVEAAGGTVELIKRVSATATEKA
jgi:large subunit ribosomal protein L15